MKPSLKEVLENQRVDSDSVQQAVRYYLAERTDDLPPEEMKQQLIDVVGNAAAVDAALRHLKQDPLML